MILLIDTSSPVLYITLIINGDTREYEWEAGRQLSRHILGYLTDRLKENDADIQDIKGIGVLRGPGSFTGLRIGLSVANALADGLKIPIVGESGDSWREQALARLDNGQNDKMVLPLYGSEAHITQPTR